MTARPSLKLTSLMLPAEVNDRFELRARLGSGSFGTVYAAFDRQRNREVALKVLTRAAPDSVMRFKREFRALADLRHPNLVSMLELLVLGDQWMLSMDLVPGVELLEHLAAAELQQSFLDAQLPTEPAFDPDATLATAIAIAAPASHDAALSASYVQNVRDTFGQVAVAVAFLHTHGVIHRDIKPSNILITRQGRVVLLDFGLVVQPDLEESFDRAAVGTPGYMSPEQVTAGAITPATDWYSFGVLLYQALTGMLPFRGGSSLELMENQLRGALPPLATAVVTGAPEDLSALATDCLDRDPARRPGDDDVLRRLGIAGFDPLQIQRERKRTANVIGRGRELRALRRHIDGAVAGHPRLVLMHGSPGVGKSTLADHLLDSLRADGGAFILAGRCRPWESLPLNAADTLVDSLARELRRERSEAVTDTLSHAVVVPHVFPLLGGTNAEEIGERTVNIPSSGERLFARAASELRSILAAASNGRPVVMLLDDAQWGDYQSARLLRGLLRPGANHATVLILCYRAEDRQTSLLLQVLLGEGIETRETVVKPLSRAMIARLIKSSIKGAGIFEESGGNPRLAQMLRGDPSLRRAVERQLAHLSTPARSLFHFVLEANGPVPEDVVIRELELFEIDEPLRALTARHLIRVRRTGDLAEMDVYHSRIREVFRG